MNNYEVGIFIQRDGYLGRSPQSMLISHSLTFHSLHSLHSHLSFKLPVKVLHLPLLTTNSLHFYHPHPLSSSSTLIAASSVSLYRLFSPLSIHKLSPTLRHCHSHCPRNCNLLLSRPFACLPRLRQAHRPALPM